MSKTKWKDMSASQRGLRLGGGIIILFLLIGIFVEPTEQTQKTPPPAREKVPTAEERAEAAFVEKHGRAPQRGLRGDYVEIRYHLREIAHDPKRSEEHTSELQSRGHLVCRLLLEKKKTTTIFPAPTPPGPPS